ADPLRAVLVLADLGEAALQLQDDVRPRLDDPLPLGRVVGELPVLVHSGTGSFVGGSHIPQRMQPSDGAGASNGSCLPPRLVRDHATTSSIGVKPSRPALLWKKEPAACLYRPGFSALRVARDATTSASRARIWSI